MSPAILNEYVWPLTTRCNVSHTHIYIYGTYMKLTCAQKSVEKEWNFRAVCSICRGGGEFFILNKWWGDSADAVPHYHKLCSRDSHIWGIRRGQSAGVQWLSLALGEPPSWSWCLPCQVSMSCTSLLWATDSGSNCSHWRCWIYK